MDKQKEIEKMACDMCLFQHCCNKPNEPIECCEPLKMAKKAVEAGYGDVRAAVKEFAESVKMAFYHEFEELIPYIIADKIDELVKEVCGDGDETFRLRKEYGSLWRRPAVYHTGIHKSHRERD